jgi:hypothetical protein
MKKFLLAVAGVFGAIPGLTVIQSGIGAPPGYKVLFGGVIEAFGTLSLLLLWINRKKIKRLSARRVTKRALALASLCFAFIAVYITLFNYCVVAHQRGTAYYPLWTSGKIADMVTRAGSRRAAIERYGIAAVDQAIDEMPGVPLELTAVVLLFLYQGIFTTLSVLFGLLGFYEGKQIEERHPRTAPTASA